MKKMKNKVVIVREMKMKMMRKMMKMKKRKKMKVMIVGRVFDIRYVVRWCV